MRKNKSIWVPILLGVLAILFAIAILVGWSILFTHYYVLNTKIKRPDLGAGYWFLLAIGCLFLLSIMTSLLLLSVDNVRQILEARQQTAFIDSVTHELKSPLAGLRLCLETMELRDITPEMQKKFMNMMKKDVERLGAFVEHILEAGRLEHNERILRYEWVKLEDVLQRCKERILKRYQPQTHHIEFHLLGEEPYNEEVMTDVVALETILLNLFDNAVKYSQAPAHIEVKVTTNSSLVSIAVSDQGRGLSPRHLKRVFGRFYRVKQDKLSTPRGTGLGLYVVDSLVKQLHGKITAASEGEMKGSTFVLSFPPEPPGRYANARSSSFPVKPFEPPKSESTL